MRIIRGHDIQKLANDTGRTVPIPLSRHKSRLPGRVYQCKHCGLVLAPILMREHLRRAHGIER